MAVLSPDLKIRQASEEHTSGSPYIQLRDIISVILSHEQQKTLPEQEEFHPQLEITNNLCFAEVHQALTDELGYELNPKLLEIMRINATAPWSLFMVHPSPTFIFAQTKNALKKAKSTIVLDRTGFLGPIQNMSLLLAGECEDYYRRDHNFGATFDPSTGRICWLSLSAPSDYFPQENSSFEEELYGGPHDPAHRPAGIFTEGMQSSVPADRQIIRIALGRGFREYPEVLNQYFIGRKESIDPGKAAVEVSYTSTEHHIPVVDVRLVPPTDDWPLHLTFPEYCNSPVNGTSLWHKLFRRK